MLGAQRKAMNWRLAAAPTSSVGKSLCSCFVLSTRLHPGVLLAPQSSRRGLCWVRREPPFPRKGATTDALLQDLAEKKHPSFIDFPRLGEDVCDAGSLSSSLVNNASDTVFRSNTFGDECNVAADKFTTFHVNAIGSQFHVQETAVSTAALTSVNANEQLHDVNKDAAFECSFDVSNAADSSQLSCDITPSVVATIDISPNDVSPPGATVFPVSLDNTSDSRTTRSRSSKAPKLRRMLKINHAVFNDHEEKRLQWFPYLNQFKVKDTVLTSTQIMHMLGPFMLEERKDRIKRVVANRTYTVCPVVEGLLDLGNIAAVFRSADALGFQSVHVISNESEKRYKKNRKISMGSEKWLDAELFQATGDCFEELRSRGYRIAVASATDKAVPISDMDWTAPTAVVFGNEFKGVSMEALQLADFSCYIPMVGMVDSFNVSVAAGIVMHHAVNDRKARLGKHGDLAEEEQSILLADFYLRHSSRSLSVIDRLLQIKQEEKKCDLRSVLNGDMDLDVELPEYLKLDLEKVCSEFNPS